MADRKSYSLDNISLKNYLLKINKTPLLTRDEEIELALKMREGDKSAKEKFIQSNLRFVVHIAKEYHNRGIPLIDLVSEGNIGLIRAVEKFDVNMNVRFTTYGVWWIRQAIRRAIDGSPNISYRTIRIPICQKIKKIRGKINEFMNNGFSYSEAIEKYASEWSKKTPDEIRHLLNVSNSPVSLDSPLHFEDGEDGFLIDDLVPSDYTNSLSTEDKTINNTLSGELEAILNEFPDKRYGEILMHRFGLNGYAPKTLKQTSEIFDITRERVRQIQKKALEMLRAKERVSHLREYLE